MENKFLYLITNSGKWIGRRISWNIVQDLAEFEFLLLFLFGSLKGD